MTKRFIKACRKEATDVTPIWLMRQAGRYMSVYRAVRERYSFLQMVKIPEVAAEVTLQPIQAFAVDAAIIFADILPPLEGLGIQLSFAKGEGPVIHNPIRSVADINALRPYDAKESSGYTLEAIQMVKRELPADRALIGFSGAPFTLASYAIEGGGSKEYRRAKGLMYSDPEAWHSLMGKLTDMVANYLLAQIEVGCEVVQIFDSWAGTLSPEDFREYVLPHVQASIAKVRAAEAAAATPPTPIIYFGTDMNGMLPMLVETGADVLGLDWRINLDDGWAQFGDSVAVQGNLDPLTLNAAPWSVIEKRAKNVLDRAAGRPGHIFNVGHGILTETPEDNVGRLVDFVHEYSATTRN